MTIKIPDFQTEQWQFLAVFKAMGGEGALDFVNELSPLSPSMMVDLLNQASKKGLLTETKPCVFHLADKIPPQIEKKLLSLVTPDYCKLLLDRLSASEFSNRINPEAKANLFSQAGMTQETLMLKYEVAVQAVKEGLLSKAYDNFLALSTFRQNKRIIPNLHPSLFQQL